MTPINILGSEQPAPSGQAEGLFGSDAIAETLRRLDVPFIAFNPGASCRGLQDSIVNYLGNTSPQLLLCIHEESAVAIAHGYWKVAGKPMAALLHSNVGLMHATMAVFNAWCDRAAVLLLGATGAWDADKRRPWVEWIHTASDQGALIRDYSKWDNQPGSVNAAVEALIRARLIACTAPAGPTYVNLDLTLQEQRIAALPTALLERSFELPSPITPDAATIERIAALLNEASSPLILMGRTSRSEDAWASRLALAETIEARVLTDIKNPAAFPTMHRLHASPPALFLEPEAKEAISKADVILALDWIDVAGTLRQALGADAPLPRIVNISPDAHSHRGWSADYQGLTPADIYVACPPDEAVSLIVPKLKKRMAVAQMRGYSAPRSDGDALTLAAVGEEIRRIMERRPVSILRLPISWSGRSLEFESPLDYIGLEGGGGVGAGPGLVTGAALALRGSGRLPLAIMGDGDFLGGVTAIWTAAHYRIPVLILVHNNASFKIDELHQERIAKARGRAVENGWIGQRLIDPAIDISKLAEAQGAQALVIRTIDEIVPVLSEGVRLTDEGHTVVIDVQITEGYVHV